MNIVQEEQAKENLYEEIIFNPCIIKYDKKFIPPSQKSDAPLAGIINPELEDIDPRRFFPNFKPSGVLRFSRVFAANCKPTIRNQIWWTSKTCNKGATNKSETIGENELIEKTIDETKIKLNIGSPPRLEDCVIDEREIYSTYSDSSYWLSAEKHSILQNSDEEDDATAWRYGPAQIWYDKMGVPVNPKRFNYGFRLKKQKTRKNFGKVSRGKDEFKNPSKEEKVFVKKKNFYDPFLPVNLVHWEDDVIIDSEEAKNKIIADFSSDKLPRCGWIPTAHTRVYQTFISSWSQGTFQRLFFQGGAGFKTNTDSGTSNKAIINENHSIFPMDNFDLKMTNWEDEIIWDSQNMSTLPEPKILTIEYDDEPKIFDLHDETFVNDEKEANCQIYGKEHQFTKKSEMILMQVQQRQRQEEEEHIESRIAQIADKDSFNLSNDDYYNVNTAGRGINLSKSGNFGNVILHSIPAQNIHRLLFPTNLTSQAPIRLRQHHRVLLTKALMRDCVTRWAPISSLTKHIRQVNEERERQKLSDGGSDVFLMRELSDLSGCDGNLVCFEYSEEHPPLLSQPGMASKIRNYYKRKASKDIELNLEYGEMAFIHNSPFLGNLAAGQCVQAIENNMYRAPIYRHSTRSTDFLFIRTKQGFFIRNCPTLFLVGQECPFYEVPPPNSKQSTIFTRHFLLAFIYRLFWESEDTPRRLKMEDIRTAFPYTAESSVRKRLKQCAEFIRGNDQNNYWVLREDFRLPTKEEVLNMVTPEMCCAHWSMLTAEQRLRDAGFGDKYFFTPENEDSSEDEVTMEDEIKCAPWNTTKAYIAALKGKCFLDQTGIADPTGCGQGFSYVKVSAKPQKEDIPQVQKRVVTGTNADLRKLPLKEAKEICREYGLREDELNSLSRWDIIHVIRTLSTQAAKARSDFNGMARFARGNLRVNFADLQEKNKQHCQHIFDLQNKALGNAEEISTDENSTDDESDNDDKNKFDKTYYKNNKKSLSKQVSFLSEAEKRKLEFEDEERERLDLQRMIRGEVTKNGAVVSKGAKEAVARTQDEFFKDENKEEFTIADPKNSTQQKSLLQDAVSKKLKIYRTFKDINGSEWTRVEVISHPQLIEAYVRIRTTKNEDFIKVFAQNDDQFKEERRKEKRRLQDQLRRLRKNEAKVEQQGFDAQKKKQKKAEREKKPPPPIKASLLKMRCSACGETGHMKTNKYCLLYGKRKKNENSLANKTVGDICPQSSHSDDLSSGMIAVEGTRLKIPKKWYNQTEKAQKDSLRLHIPRRFLEQDKKVENSKFQNVCCKGDSKNLKKITSYSDLDRIASLDSDKQAQPNSNLSNSINNLNSRRRGTVEEADYLVGPHKSVQRRRADPRVSMASVLNEIFTELKGVQNAEHLMFPVNAKKVPDYYTVIEKPMDLQQIRHNISENRYELRRQFLEDLAQIWQNSKTYNGAEHIITKAAKNILDLATLRLTENEERLIELEKAINPLLDDNDRVGFSHILKEIIEGCRNLPKSAAFHAKVDTKKFPLYSEKVKRPMDLGTIEQNTKEHYYASVAEFINDVKQIYINSQIYNGPHSSYTEKAVEIVNMAEKLIEKHKQALSELEENIQNSLRISKCKEDNQSLSSCDQITDVSINPSTKSVNNCESIPRFQLGMDENSQQASQQSQTLPDDAKLWQLSGFSQQSITTDEEETRMSGGILQDDLALSNDEFSNAEDNDEVEIETGEWNNQNSTFYQSQMHTSGQLNADLALSDSDDSDEEYISAKRPKFDDLNSSL